MLEQWKPILGYEDYYEISNFGRVKRVKKGAGAKEGKILRTSSYRASYPSADLCKNGKATTHQIHTLVLLAFVGPKPSPQHECNHKDGDKGNSFYLNLEWNTPKENCAHKHDVLKKAKGENHYRSKDCLITSPSGETFKVKGLRQFCIKHNISSGKMSAVARHELTQHKGWICQYA